MFSNVKSFLQGAPHMPKSYLTVRDVAKQLELTEYRIRQLIREKEIRATKIGQWRISPEDLRAFIQRRTNK